MLTRTYLYIVIHLKTFKIENMKNIILTFLLAGLTTIGFSQIKVLTSGSVGIGGINATSQALEVNGNTKVRKNLLVGEDAGTSMALFRVGAFRSENGPVGFDFVSDKSNYADYGDRFLRNSTGVSIFTHRGTKVFRFRNEHAAPLEFWTTSAQRLVVEAGGDIGMGVSNPTVKLHVGGDLITTGVVNGSDRRLKKDINNYEGGLEKLLRLEPKTYFYNGKGSCDSEILHYGFIAQDLKEIEPNAVGDFLWEKHDEDGNVLDSDTYLSIQPAAVQSMLVNSVKEQQAIIDTQEERITKLEAQIAALIDSNNQAIDISGGNPSKAVLGDNFPNPFGSQTDIRYFLPENAENATLNLYDNSGKLIRSVNIAERGNGVLNINFSDMPAGVYNYQMVVDDKLVATKKMVLGN